MNAAKRTFFLLVTVSLVYSCHRDKKQALAIRDFDKSLRPFLLRAVSTGIVGSGEAEYCIKKYAKNKDLLLLSGSEHPILRATALREMLSRPSFDHFALIMNHLDDTAIVAVDMGEWGVQFRTISDYLVVNGTWKTIGDKEKTIEEIIMKHDYLRTAYTGLVKVELREKYYPYIREMVQRERPFEEREEALLALARFKRKVDIPLIKEVLLKYGPQMSSSSFRLMEDFPDTSYMEVLRHYYPRRFYRSICGDNWGSADRAVEYISALASYKSDSSEKILYAILSKKPFVPCPADTGYLRQHLLESIWNNPCPAYLKLRAQIRVEVGKMLRRDSLNAMHPPLVDTTSSIKDTAAAGPVWW